MAAKNTEDITITLRKTTVAKMRKRKRELSWNEYVLSLMKSAHQGSRAECVFCGCALETEDIYKSPSVLAKENNWTEISIKGQQAVVGFICNFCILRRTVQEI